MADYKINHSNYQSSALCACGHRYAAHGTNGFICCQCPCKKFKEVLDGREPKEAKSIP